MTQFRIDKSYSAAALSNKDGQGKRASIWNREIEFTKAFSGKEKQHFFHLLSILLDSGLSITESLEILEGQIERKKSKAIIRAIMQSLNEGAGLSDTLAQHAQHFSKFEIYSVKMGESSGKMVAVLEDLASYHEKRQKLQRKFIQAFSYPIVVICVAGAVLGFMIAFVVPMFKDIFTRFDAELPGITQFVLALSEAATNWGGYGLLCLGLLVLGLIRLRKNERVKRVFSNVLLKVPLLGNIVLKIQLSRFCYTLALMLKSKVTLDQALDLMAQIISFPPIQSTLQPIKKDVIEGGTLFDAVSKHRIFPPMLRQMVRVGEKTAKLDTMMERLGKNLEEEGELGITTLTNLLEPLLIVILGIIVGVILVSMYLPMFELSNTIGG